MDTLKIRSTDEASQGPFVIINKDDFDPAVHEALDPVDVIADDSSETEAAPARRGRKPKAE
jgi:hypothetical protein